MGAFRLLIPFITGLGVCAQTQPIDRSRRAPLFPLAPQDSSRGILLEQPGTMLPQEGEGRVRDLRLKGVSDHEASKTETFITQVRRGCRGYRR
jgi:hypothetical protein